MTIRPLAWIPWIPAVICPLQDSKALAEVLPVLETTPVPSRGDAADDAAFWVHPTDPALSTLICTDKEAGLAVYDLSGKQMQFLQDGKLNNVDLRHDFPLGGARVDLVTSGEKETNRLAIYVVDPSTRLLRDAAARVITLGIRVGGCCMYRSPVTGDTYFFGTSKSGEAEQWRLFDAGEGRVDAERVRAFDVGGASESCVADDETGHFFVSEETVGIWRYGAEPDAGTQRFQVDRVGKPGHLSADVEGLAIYYSSGGAGYLLASSQGNDRFVVYDRRAPHAHRLSFRVGENPGLGIDRVTETDGIDVLNLALGEAFPDGALVVQDGTNQGANQNFKLVPWGSIARAANPPLRIDASTLPPGAARARDASAEGGRPDAPRQRTAEPRDDRPSEE